jgi:hypothetical protein
VAQVPAEHREALERCLKMIRAGLAAAPRATRALVPGTVLGNFRLAREIGRGGMSIGEDRPLRPPAPGGGGAPTPGEAAEREAEVRQMLEARNERRVRRGQAPLDIEAELAALVRGAAPAADPALVAEVRDLVIARNERRVRMGKEPLDVEAEVARQLRELG